MGGWDGEIKYKGVGDHVGGESEDWTESPTWSCLSNWTEVGSGSQKFLSSDLENHRPVGSLAPSKQAGLNWGLIITLWDLPLEQTSGLEVLLWYVPDKSGNLQSM